MGKLLKFKQLWCYNFTFGHRDGSADDLELTVTWHPYNKKFEVKITNECVKCGAEILLSIEFLTPSEYVRFNSKHLFDKFVQIYANERIYDYTVFSEGIKKERRVRKV